MDGDLVKYLFIPWLLSLSLTLTYLVNKQSFLGEHVCKTHTCGSENSGMVSHNQLKLGSKVRKHSSDTQSHSNNL